MNLTFEWDEAKAAFNLRKHKISFDEGKTVFGDPLLLTFPDVKHLGDESRYISIGASSKGRLLVVVHLDRKSNVRIISCRKATPAERTAYEEGD
jgi:uncharacterized DUF497 family protein